MVPIRQISDRQIELVKTGAHEPGKGGDLLVSDLKGHFVRKCIAGQIEDNNFTFRHAADRRAKTGAKDLDSLLSG